jgi:hypothetical protein
VLMGAGWAACCWAYVRFLTEPTLRTDRLTSLAVTFIVAVLLAQVYGFAFAQP